MRKLIKKILQRKSNKRNRFHLYTGKEGIMGVLQMLTVFCQHLKNHTLKKKGKKSLILHDF